MRLSILPVAFALVAGVSAQQKPLQVYLHPTPAASAPDSPPTLSADQAKAVLAHHLGQPIDDFEEIPSDEGLWTHLMGMWSGEKVLGAEEKARVVIIEGGVMPQDVLPSTISQNPSFYLKEETSTRALLAPYLQRASHFLDNVLHSLPGMPDKIKDLFALAESRAAALLEKELASLSAMADSIPWVDHSSKQAYPWEAISISGLNHLDRSDELWETGCKGLQAGLESMTTPNSPPLLVIIVPRQATTFARAIPGFADLADAFDSFASNSSKSNATLEARACYSSNSTCSESTTCYGRGMCVLKSKRDDKECWGCKCESGFAGVSCQKTDYSTPFVILIITTLFLLATLGGSVALLHSVGDTKLPSTLNLAIGNPKRD